MGKKAWGFCAGILLMVHSIGVQADVIVNTETTTDTAQGLEFLHVNIPSDMTYPSAQAGFQYGGFNWQLATVDQFLTLMENATGTSIPDWDGSNLGDWDFNSTQADAMMAALGYGPSSETPWFWLNGGANGAAEALAHTSCCDDFHLNQTTPGESLQPALFVKGGEIAPVPGLAQWGMILLVMLMLGLATAHLYRRV